MCVCDPTQPSLFSEPDAAQFAVFLKHNDGAISLMEAVVILIMSPNCAPADLVFQMSALELCVYSYCTRHSITPFACFVQRRSQRCLKACVHVLTGCTSLCQCVPQRVLEISESFKAANQ